MVKPSAPDSPLQVSSSCFPSTVYVQASGCPAKVKMAFPPGLRLSTIPPVSSVYVPRIGSIQLMQPVAMTVVQTTMETKIVLNKIALILTSFLSSSTFSGCGTAMLVLDFRHRKHWLSLGFADVGMLHFAVRKMPAKTVALTQNFLGWAGIHLRFS